MLYVSFLDDNYVNNENYIKYPRRYFDTVYKDPSWVFDELDIKMVEDIDKTKHVMGKVFDSPIFGVIAPSELSGGVKTLMLANHYNDLCYNITGCGENCAKWFEYLGSNKDLHVVVKYIMPFEDYSKIYSLDLNRFFKDYDDYARSYINLKY